MQNTALWKSWSLLILFLGVTLWLSSTRPYTLTQHVSL